MGSFSVDQVSGTDRPRLNLAKSKMFKTLQNPHQDALPAQ